MAWEIPPRQMRQALNAALRRRFTPSPQSFPETFTEDTLFKAMRRSFAIGRTTHLLSGYPAVRMVRQLVDVPASEARRISRRLNEGQQGNATMHSIALRAGVDAIKPLLGYAGEKTVRERAAGKQGAIFVFCHAGPALAIPAGIAFLGLRALLMTLSSSRLRYPAEIEVWRGNAPENAFLFLKRAAEYLRAGNSVLLAMDGLHGESSVEVSVMRRRIGFRKGIGILHGMTGAPIVPVLPIWRSEGRMSLEFLPDLTSADGASQRPSKSDVVALQLGRSFERMILRDPGNLRMKTFEMLVGVPTCSDGSGADQPSGSRPCS